MLLRSSRYEELNREGADLIEAYGATAYPLDPFSLAAKMGIRLRPYSSFTRAERAVLGDVSKDAFTVSMGKYEVGTTFICFNQDANEGRLRQSIAHEIAHIWLEHPNCEEPYETEAEYLAAYVMAPIPIIIKKRLRTVGEVKDFFGISYEAARIAFERAQNRIRCRKPGYEYEFRIIDMCSKKGDGRLEGAERDVAVGIGVPTATGGVQMHTT